MNVLNPASFIDNKIKLSDLPGRATLELHDCEIIANAINVFGSGDHPMAHAQKNLDYFHLDYILECLDKGIEATKSESFREEVTDLWTNIHMAKEDEEGRRKWQKANNAVNENDAALTDPEANR